MSSKQQTLFSESYDRLPLRRTHPIDVITTVNGGTDTSYAAARSGVMVGIRSNYTRPPNEVPIDFVDWPFMETTAGACNLWEQHLEVVKRERPQYAVAPDIDDNVSYNEAIGYAVELQEYCETVIVVPKSIHPADVPDQFRVGMPCQERFGGTPHPWSAYQDCSEVHILGGHPSKQIQVDRYYVPVRSIDSAVPISRANWGDVWSFSEQKFVRERRGYYGSIERSLANVWAAWNGVNTCLGRRERMKYNRPDSKYHHDPLDLDGLISDDEEIPFPGRAWCYENNINDWRQVNNQQKI